MLKKTALLSLVFSIMFVSACSKSGGSNFLVALLGMMPQVPGISSVTPADGSTGISVITTVQVRFTKEMNGASITNTSFVVRDDGDNIVAGDNPVYADRVATFTPDSPLANLKTYTATLSTTITDLKGKPLKQEYSWSFTTVSAGQVPAPEFSANPGTYDSTQSVALSCDDVAADIYYTTNGDAPDSDSTHYDATPINVDHNMTLRAIAVRDGYDNSEIAGGDYHIQAPKPGFSPEEGEHNHDIDVTLSVTGGATIYYTTGTGDPDIEYNASAIEIHGDGNSGTIRARSTKAGMDDSDIVEETYSVNYSTAAAPTFDPVGGTFSATQNVTLETTTGGATIRYTTDGSDPKEAGNPNTHDVASSSTVEVAQNTTIRAYTFMTGMKDSGTTGDDYYIQLATPDFSETQGTYSHDLEIHLTAGAGETIYYTLGTGDPDIEYDDLDPILVEGHGADVTIRVKAVRDGFTDSGIVSARYQVQYDTLSTPVMDPDGGTYTTAQSVTITSDVGSTIRYTTDGSDPKRVGCDTCTDAASPATVAIDDTKTVRAFAYQTMMLDSAEAQENYLIAPTIEYVCPVSGQNNGAVSITDLTGTNFKTGVDVRLMKSGQSDIVASEVSITGTTQISCTLDITGAAAGKWDVVVINTDGVTATMTEGFRIYSIPRDGLVGEWLFSGNVEDTSGNDNHGGNYGMTYALDRFSSGNYSGSFNGSSYVRCINSSSLDINTGEMTISAWIYASSLPSGQSYIVSKWGSGNSWILLLNSTGTVAFVLFSGEDLISDRAITLNQWNHITATYSSSEGLMKIYINDVFCGQRSETRAIADSGMDMFIGGWQYYNGMIDDVRIYDRAISLQEIQGITSSGEAEATGEVLLAKNISATRGTFSDHIAVSWDAAIDATGYDIYRDTSSSGSFSTKVNTETVASTTFDDSTVTPGTLYFYRIQSKNSCVSGSLSTVSGYGWAGTLSMPATGLVAEWLFNGNTLDTSGNAHHGTGTDVTMAPDRNSVANNACYLNGTSSYITVNTINDAFVDGFSVSFWVNMPAAMGMYARILDFGNGSYSDNICIFYMGGCLDYQGYNIDTGGSYIGTCLGYGSWYHICFVSDSAGNSRVYSNGALASTGYTGVLRNIARASNFIGKSNWTGEPLFHGYLDNMRYYKRALTADEVFLLYNDQL